MKVNENLTSREGAEREREREKRKRERERLDLTLLVFILRLFMFYPFFLLNCGKIYCWRHNFFIHCGVDGSDGDDSDGNDNSELVGVSGSDDGK